MHPNKTRITHIRWGFEFLGYKIKQGKGLRLSKKKVVSKMNRNNLYAYPKNKFIEKFMNVIRDRTRRRLPLVMKELIDYINSVIRRWGNYFRKSHVRKLFNRLDRWIVRRLWNHHYKRWRNSGWKKYPHKNLYEKYGLVNLVGLIPSIQ